MELALFKRFRDIAYERAGISLGEGKQSLVEARVSKRLRALGLSHASDYLDYLEDPGNDEELIHFLDAISTNYTFFFREADHFAFLTECVKRWLDSGQKRFRFWSAASSSGEEPYSIAITLHEAFEGKGIDYRLLATDISTRVLQRAYAGVYSEEALRQVSKAHRLKYFDRMGSRAEEDAEYQVKQFLKDIVVYKRLNLSTPPFPMSGPLDAVFCRNVMIYFDRPVRQRLVSEIERLLKPGGVLMIGHTETLTGIATGLRVIRPSMYEKPHVR